MKNSVTMDPASRVAIRNAAFRLFRSVGYKNTSYSMIAEESGQGRPLVQYYYPKKEDFAMEFILEALQIIDDLLKESTFDSDDPAVRTTRYGQIYYGFLLYDEAMKRFTGELLENRNISGRLVSINAEATLPSLVDEPTAERMRAASIKATGGIYEWLYLQLLSGADLDAKECAVQNVAAFLTFSGRSSYEEAYRILEKQTLEPGVLAEMEERLLQQLLQ